jgi:hypothetical protein
VPRSGETPPGVRVEQPVRAHSQSLRHYPKPSMLSIAGCHRVRGVESRRTREEGRGVGPAGEWIVGKTELNGKRLVQRTLHASRLTSFGWSQSSRHVVDVHFRTHSRRHGRCEGGKAQAVGRIKCAGRYSQNRWITLRRKLGPNDPCNVARNDHRAAVELQG